MASVLNEHTQYIDPTTKAPLVDGRVWFGVAGADPTISTTPIFSDRALTTALANPQVLDSSGRSTNKVYIPGRYSIAVYDVLGNLKYQNLDNGEAQEASIFGLSNVLGTNAITAEATPAITALADNSLFLLEIVTENTADAVTLDIDGTGAKAIKRNFNQDVGKGRFKVGQKVLVAYNLGNDNYELANQNLSVHHAGSDSIAAAASMDLSVALSNNINVTGHAGPITALGTVLAGTVFKLLYAGSSPVAITSSSVASPTNILCGAAHGLSTGDTVLIEGHSGSIPNINGTHPVTVVDTTNFTIPVNVATGGTGGTVAGVPVMNHNSTSLILKGANNRVFSPGDSQELISLGSGNFRELDYTPAKGVVPTGLVLPYIGTAAPNGWVLAGGGTIGNLSSGGTQRANADTEALFTLLWNSMADAQAPVSTGRGASAAADFAANKTITIPNLSDSAPFGTASVATPHGASGGAATHTLTQSEMPAHTHAERGSPGTASDVTPTVTATALNAGNAAGDAASSTLTGSTGGGSAHNNMPPWVALAYIIKL